MILAAIILLLLIAFILFVATRPDDFRIERSLSMQARPEQIFPLLNDFHEWEAWSPWEKVDPAVRRSYSGPQHGQAAVYAWAGNKELGEGRMEILESQPFNYLRIQINFYKPFAAQNTIEFRLDEQGPTTLVSQAMFGSCNFMSKLMGLFFSMDNMVGKKFDEGLLDLKNIVEKS
ncbi:SRPBCC family protein [Undibacterium pigrum]|uniref:Polyketide cyclase/dehydrase/lipid transport protein n=1 Tax=Undibacterium pigrum TaxID=401470 RepID=A0A318JM67_9BURK|nr:SRPBCC family protein [Undibacterium pigrum]PXX45051.1 polyketide cyclase/dehydrase/lipid transport protein [Undibacterium pigrum]